MSTSKVDIIKGQQKERSNSLIKITRVKNAKKASLSVDIR